jgi:thioredoxin reductase (NADPH)
LGSEAGAVRILSDDSRKTLVETFKALKRKIVIEVYTKDGVNEPYNQLSLKFVGELMEISDKIEGRFYKIGEKRAEEMAMTRSPTVLIEPERYRIRYTGAPAGEEGRSFIQTLVMASMDDSLLSPKGRKRLIDLRDKRAVQVFVTPACPYCPGEVITANGAAIERPDLISSEVVESAENIDLAKQYNVGSVPQTVVNGKTINIGMQTEEMFIEGMITLVPHEIPTQRTQANDLVGEFDLIIVGAGPAGLTAAIYAARSGLHAILLEKSVPGGQVALTPLVENWPGMTSIPGKQLVDMMVQHAKSYAHLHEGEEVTEIKVGKRIEAMTPNGRYVADALLIATGATHKKMGVPGEDRLYGKGVSYCSTCDGFFYKGRDVMVIGGGNTAMTDAMYLNSLGCKVTIIHRRDAFRAEKRLVDNVTAMKIPAILNAEVVEIKGDKNVESMVIKDASTGKDSTLKTDAVFIAIGETPMSEIAASIGVKVDESGFINVDSGMRTSIPRVYAAGDVTGGVRQIVTAVGSGSIAALTVFSDLSSARANKK